MTQLLKNKKGTTLVELVVCMVLLSLFTVAAVTLIQPSAKAFQQIQNQTRAQNLADAVRNNRVLLVSALSGTEYFHGSAGMRAIAWSTAASSG